LGRGHPADRAGIVASFRNLVRRGLSGGAAGIILLPLAHLPKCLVGMLYTVMMVPAMMFAGLLGSCAAGDCL
jgi:hypothetical protein